MAECPECGAAVPEDGKFCPECGTDLAYARGDGRYGAPSGDDRRPREPPAAETGGEHRREPTSREQYDDRPPRDSYDEPPRDVYDRPPGEPVGARPGQPGRPPAPAYPRPADHKLMLGSVVALGVIGFIEGAAQALYPEVFLELVEQQGLGFEDELTAELFLITGALGVVVSLAVLGATVYYYREGLFRKAYFWLLIGSGAAGFLLVGSLFLTLLVAFGIYGLVKVMD